MQHIKEYKQQQLVAVKRMTIIYKAKNIFIGEMLENFRYNVQFISDWFEYFGMC